MELMWLNQITKTMGKVLKTMKLEDIQSTMEKFEKVRLFGGRARDCERSRVHVHHGRGCKHGECTRVRTIKCSH